VIVAVIVLIVVVCGTVFATFVTFMIMNKIIKRHLYLLERQQTVEVEMVVDLDDPDQVSRASGFKEGVVEKQPLVGYSPVKDAYSAV